MKTVKPINVIIWDNVIGTMEVDCWIQYYDVITNPRCQTATNKKIVMSAYLGEK